MLIFITLSVYADNSCQQGHAQGDREANGTEVELVFSVVDTEVEFTRIARPGVVNTDNLTGLFTDIT